MAAVPEPYNITAYKKGVIHRMQNAGWITRGLFQTAVEKSASEVKYMRMGAIEATELQKGQGDSPTANPDGDTITAAFKNYEVNPFYKTAEQSLIGVNLEQAFQAAAAKAMGRRFDTIPFRVLDTAAGAIETIGDGSVEINPNHVEDAAMRIYDAGGDMLDVYCGLPTQTFAQLLTYKSFVAAEYVNDTPLMKKLAARKLGMVTYVPMPSKYFANPSGAIRDAYMWAKEAVGFDWNEEWKHSPWYDGRAKGWRLNNDMSCACAVLEPDAVKRLRFNNIAPSHARERV